MQNNNNNSRLLVSLPLYFFYAVFIVYNLRIAPRVHQNRSAVGYVLVYICVPNEK